MTISKNNWSKWSDRPIKVMDFKVDQMLFYTPKLFLMTLSPADPQMEIPVCHPGQFIQIRVPSDGGAFLRRPISIYSADKSSMEILVQNVGKGTNSLSKVRVGDCLSLILPLGNYFSSPSELCPAKGVSDLHPLLIGGGVGIAPLLMLGKELKADGIVPTFLLGARSKGFFPDLSKFDETGRLFISTEDGTFGDRGFVTDHSIISNIKDFDCIYTCGPTPMMKAVAALAKVHDIPCEASLENHMACGFGVCLCCTEPTTEGYKSVCTDGPVFNVDHLLWNTEAL